MDNYEQSSNIQQVEETSPSAEQQPLTGWAKRFSRKRNTAECECGGVGGADCSCDWNWFGFG